MEEQLLSYIKQSTTNGMTKEEIEKNLLAKGWNADDIKAAFLQSERTPQVQPQNEAVNLSNETHKSSPHLKIILGVIFIFLILSTTGGAVYLKMKSKLTLQTESRPSQIVENSDGWKLTWVRNKNELPKDIEEPNKTLLLSSLLTSDATQMGSGKDTAFAFAPYYPEYVYMIPRQKLENLKNDQAIQPISNPTNDWATFGGESLAAVTSEKLPGRPEHIELEDVNNDGQKNEMIVLLSNGGGESPGGLVALDESGKILWKHLQTEGYDSNDFEIFGKGQQTQIIADIGDEVWLLNLQGDGNIIWKGEEKTNIDGKLRRPDILDLGLLDSDNDGQPDRIVIVDTTQIVLIDFSGKVLKSIPINLPSQHKKIIVVLEDQISHKEVVSALISDKTVELFNSDLESIKSIPANEKDYQFYRDIDGLDLDGDGNDDSFLATTGQELNVYDFSGKNVWGVNIWNDNIFEKYRCSKGIFETEESNQIFTDFGENVRIKTVDLDNDNTKDDFIVVAQKVGCDRSSQDSIIFPAILFFTR